MTQLSKIAICIIIISYIGYLAKHKFNTDEESNVSQWTEQHLRNTIDFIDWTYVSYNISKYDLSSNFVKEYQYKLDWSIISKESSNTEFIKKYENVLDWQFIFYQPLASKFIKDYDDKFSLYDDFPLHLEWI